MEQTLFYVAGIILALLAVSVSFYGLRFEKFPPTRVALFGGVGAFVLMVLITTTGAVINARDEQEEREAELAREEAPEVEQAAGEAATAEETGTEGPAGVSPQQAEKPLEEGVGEAEETLMLSSPEDGATSFDPSSLKAKSGSVTLDYNNPSPVEHNVALEQDGELLGEGELVTDGDTSTATADLAPGEYVYYCTVPGHRESGMEGALSVE